jgi:histidine triad (HIT) family protein
MDIQPVNPGHVLVVPKSHAAFLSDLPPQTGGKIFQVAQQMAAALVNSGFKCDGVNLFLANGEAAGQDVFHVHLHVIPRFKEDGFGFKFPPGYGNRPTRDALDKMANQIQNNLNILG